MANRVRIGYINAMETATSVVADNVDSQNPVENLYDWKVYDFYQMNTAGSANIVVTMPGSTEVDYFAMYKQNLWSTGGTIKLQYWNSSAYVDCFTAFTPADDKPLMKTFTKVTASKFRVVVSSTPVGVMGCAAFGKYMEMEHGLRVGFAPPRFSRSTEVSGTMSESGIPLGQTVLRKGFRTSLNFEFISEAFARTALDPFLQHIEEKPFFILWDSDNYPDEAAFCKLDGDTPPAPYTHHGHMSCTIPTAGLIE